MKILKKLITSIFNPKTKTHWDKLSKEEKIKDVYENMLSMRQDCIETYEYWIREWKLITKSPDILTLEEAKKKFNIN